MGLWSRIKNAVKKVWRAVKAVVRIIVRVVITIVNALTLGLVDLLLGFIAWPPKRLRLHVFILSTEGPVFDPNSPSLVPVVPVQEAVTAVNNMKRIYKERFNVNVRPYSETSWRSSTRSPRRKRCISNAGSARSSEPPESSLRSISPAGWVFRSH